MNSFLEFVRSTSPLQEYELCLSQATKPILDVAEILLSIERLHSTSSIGDPVYPRHEYSTAFLHVEHDEALRALALGSDTVAPEQAATDNLPFPIVCPQLVTPKQDNVFAAPPTAQHCCNCLCVETTLWRRVGPNLMCNACALYLKLHGQQRPKELLRSEIKRRRRKNSNST